MPAGAWVVIRTSQCRPFVGRRPKSGSHLDSGARGCINATLVLVSSSGPSRYFCPSAMYSLGSSSSLTVVATLGQNPDSSRGLSMKLANAILRPSGTVYEFREQAFGKKEQGGSIDREPQPSESQAQQSQTSAQIPLRVRLANRKPPSPSHLPHFKCPLN